MTGGKRVVQLFVRPRELLVVLEDPAGGRTRERWGVAGPDAAAEIGKLARQLARRSDVDGLGRLRARRERQGRLRDDEACGRAFREAFEAERART